MDVAAIVPNVPLRNRLRRLFVARDVNTTPPLPSIRRSVAAHFRRSVERNKT